MLIIFYLRFQLNGVIWYVVTMKEWRLVQKQTFNSLKKISDYLELSQKMRNLLLQNEEFPLHVPIRIAKKMPKNCVENPLALQIPPLIVRELRWWGGRSCRR